jgi:hypothetical protein
MRKWKGRSPGQSRRGRGAKSGDSLIRTEMTRARMGLAMRAVQDLNGQVFQAVVAV